MKPNHNKRKHFSKNTFNHRNGNIQVVSIYIKYNMTFNYLIPQFENLHSNIEIELKFTNSEQEYNHLM
jgi:hypothetical protein